MQRNFILVLLSCLLILHFNESNFSAETEFVLLVLDFDIENEEREISEVLEINEYLSSLNSYLFENLTILNPKVYSHSILLNEYIKLHYIPPESV